MQHVKDATVSRRPSVVAPHNGTFRFPLPLGNLMQAMKKPNDACSDEVLDGAGAGMY